MWINVVAFAVGFVIGTTFGIFLSAWGRAIDEAERKVWGGWDDDEERGD